MMAGKSSAINQIIVSQGLRKPYNNGANSVASWQCVAHQIWQVGSTLMLPSIYPKISASLLKAREADWTRNYFRIATYQ
jgi:hypothetical protein